MDKGNEKLSLLKTRADEQKIENLEWNGQVSTSCKDNTIRYICPVCHSRGVSIYWAEFYYRREQKFPCCNFCRNRAGTSSIEKYQWLVDHSNGIPFTYDTETINSKTIISFNCPLCTKSVSKTFLALRTSKSKFYCRSCAEALSTKDSSYRESRIRTYHQKGVRDKIRTARAQTLEAAKQTLPLVYSRGLVGFEYVSNGTRPDGKTRFRQDYKFLCENCGRTFTRAKSTIRHELEKPWVLRHCYCSVCSSELGGYYSGLGDQKEEIYLRRQLRISFFQYFQEKGLPRKLLDYGLHHNWVLHHIVPVGLVYQKNLDKRLISSYPLNGIILPEDVHHNLHRAQYDIPEYSSLRDYFQVPYPEYPKELVRRQEIRFLEDLRACFKDRDYEDLFDAWMKELEE